MKDNNFNHRAILTSNNPINKHGKIINIKSSVVLQYFIPL